VFSLDNNEAHSFGFQGCWRHKTAGHLSQQSVICHVLANGKQTEEKKNKHIKELDELTPRLER
jgi:hypothetical protein